MNILQLTPRVPFPLTDGGAIGIYNITKHLSLRGHKIRLLTFSSKDMSIPFEMERYCEVRIVRFDTGHSFLKVLLSFIKGFPYSIWKYQSKTFYRILDEEVSKKKFDLVHADHLAMAPYAYYLKQKYGLPIFLREHNFESTFLERYAQQEKNIFVKAYVRIEAARMRKYEPNLCKRFDNCIMITQKDESVLKTLQPDAVTSVIPAGMDLPETHQSKSKEMSILFLASLDWKPNIDGLFWFLEKVLPVIVEKEPRVHIKIVGKGNTNRIKIFQHPSIEIIGFVEDVSKYIIESMVCIVPLFTGSGMRIKILEMMAYEKAIVSTSIGCEGIDVKNAEHLLIADKHNDFADAILRLFSNEQMRKKLGRSARQIVQDEYSWEHIAGQFEHIYQSSIINHS